MTANLIVPTVGYKIDREGNPFSPKTNISLSRVSINKDQIIRISNNFNSNKTHGCNGISVLMLKLCAAEVEGEGGVGGGILIIFKKCIQLGEFPVLWKYANVQSVHRKENRQIISNYRPISLLPICGKILEKIVFDQVYKFFERQ